MIGVSESLIRHSRRVSGDPQDARGGAVLDNLLCSSPPLPAPPLMQQAQILAQERELEQQMRRLHHHHAQRPSVTAITVDPVYLAPVALPAAASSPLKARAPSGGLALAFAKVEVAPRLPAPVASSFMPSSLGAALTDSGLLFRQQAAGGRGGEDSFSRISSREHARGGVSDSGGGDGRGDPDTITIFLHPYSNVSVRPARIRLQLPSAASVAAAAASSSSSSDQLPNANPNTDEVVANLLQKWSSGELATNFGLRATLQPSAASAASWCLKMCDEDTVSDDEDDDDVMLGEGRERMASDEELGMPEEDLPPLERSKPVRMFGVQFLAMVVADGCEHRMPSAAAALTVNTTNGTSPQPLSLRPSTPTSPSATSSSVTPPPLPPQFSTTANPSSRNPAASPMNLRRYDSVRITPVHGPNGATSPQATKVRTVSVFSGTRSSIDLSAYQRDARAASMDGHAADDRSQFSQHAFAHDPNRMSITGGPSSPSGAGRVYLKIHIGDHESHVLGLLKSQLLADALPMLSTKKNALVAMKADNYRFTYVDPLLRPQNEGLRDMTRVLVGSLASDELNLTPKLGGSGSGNERRAEGGNATTTPNLLAATDDANSSEAPSLSSFQFSLDTASNYCEYKVIKTNQRGKRQHRIFGVDRYRIYNKTQSGADEGEGGGMFSFIQRRISSDQSVSRAYRMINTIASVHVVSLRPTCFCISFKADARKDSPIAQTREYEAETKLEAAEICAKVRFLMSHAVPDPPQSSSFASPGMLAQSLK